MEDSVFNGPPLRAVSPLLRGRPPAAAKVARGVKLQLVLRHRSVSKLSADARLMVRRQRELIWFGKTIDITGKVIALLGK